MHETRRNAAQGLLAPWSGPTVRSPPAEGSDDAPSSSRRHLQAMVPGVGPASKMPVDAAGAAAAMDGLRSRPRRTGAHSRLDAFGVLSPSENRQTTAGFPQRQQAPPSTTMVNHYGNQHRPADDDTDFSPCDRTHGDTSLPTGQKCHPCRRSVLSPM